MLGYLFSSEESRIGNECRTQWINDHERNTQVPMKVNVDESPQPIAENQKSNS